MKNPQNHSGRDELIENLARDADIVAIAGELGLRVVNRRSPQPKARCPFHDDRKPSLALFRGSGSSRPQFHCFACEAHGDVFDLIKKQLPGNFSDALRWLGDRMGIAIPSTGRIDAITVSRISGLRIADNIYSAESPQEVTNRRSFAELRGFDPEFLYNAGVYAVEPPKLSVQLDGLGREERDALEASGLLVRRRPQSISQSTNLLPFDLPPRDFYITPRVLFKICDDRGRITGFAGRSTSENDEPKYLFSPGFPKAKTLYRLDQLRSRYLDRKFKNSDVVELFVVEGLLDALRLESLKIDAVCIFGTRISSDQMKALESFADLVDRKGARLVVHLFLDADQAGHRSVLSNLTELLETSAKTTSFGIDVISLPEAGGKRDPDQLLRETKTAKAARRFLYEFTFSPMTMLLSSSLGCEPSELEILLADMPRERLIPLYRNVERRLNQREWNLIFDRLDPFVSWSRPGELTNPIPSWHSQVKAFLIGSTSRSLESIRTSTSAPDKAEENKLTRALHIAQSSTQRRELPVDEGSWDRLKAAIDATVPHLTELLEHEAKLDEPMIAIRVPKSDGEFRLKALPCPEFLTVQQYVLNEILRDYPGAQRFLKWIPGVRFTAGVDGPKLETTGATLSAEDADTVSFAYQLDMDVISGRIPPRKEGMFRPYFSCWQDFITFIDRRVRACKSNHFHVARLDIRKFYDTLQRSTVVEAILPNLQNALRELDDNNAGGALACARLFSPNTTDPEQRARRIVDWLCGQSFNYEYEDPSSAALRQSNAGIPQGPDLSAYLANIALFPLDQQLRRLTGELDREARESSGDQTIRGAVYARYVDDMVIVA